MLHVFKVHILRKSKRNLFDQRVKEKLEELNNYSLGIWSIIFKDIDQQLFLPYTAGVINYRSEEADR